MARLPTLPLLPTHGYMGQDSSEDAFTPPSGGVQEITAVTVFTATTEFTAEGVEN